MNNSDPAHRKAPARGPNRLVGLAAMLGVVGLFGLFYARLEPGEAEQIPSTLVGKPAPPLALRPLGDEPVLSDADLRAGHATILNVFGSWCAPCRVEHRTLLSLAKDPALRAAGVDLVGFAFQDRPADTLAFLGKSGNPFRRLGADDGASTAWRVSGVPQTFVIAGDGTVIAAFAGPLGRRTQAEVARLALGYPASP